MIGCSLFITEAVLGHVEIMLQSRCWKKIKKTIHVSLTDLLDSFFQTNKTTALMKKKKKKKDLGVGENTNQPDTHSSFLCEYVFSTSFKWRRELRTPELREKWAKTDRQIFTVGVLKELSVLWGRQSLFRTLKRSWSIRNDPDAGGRGKTGEK